MPKHKEIIETFRLAIKGEKGNKVLTTPGYLKRAFLALLGKASWGSFS